MTDKPTPTDAELKAMWQLHAADIGGIFDFARAVLAKWGTPAGAEEPFCWHWENTFNGGTGTVKKNPETLGINMAHPDYKWTALYTTPQPTQVQPIAQAAEPVARLVIGKTKGGVSLTHMVVPAAYQLQEGTYALYTAPQPSPTAPATQQAGWTNADADAARLALELECLLMDTKDTAAVSKWWQSANEALELHRARLQEVQPSPTAQAAECVPAPPPPPECETEAEKRAFAFGWFKALESERMKAESVLEDAARYRWLRRWKGQEHEPPFTVQHEIDGTLWGGDLDAAIDAAMNKGCCRHHRSPCAAGGQAMSQDEIIAMAKEAGFQPHIIAARANREFARFAALVAAKEREAIAAHYDAQPHVEFFGRELADEIRARGKP